MSRAASLLDRDRTVLLVIDVQERLAAVMSARSTVISRCALLISAAAITGVPIVATRQYPKGLGDLEPEMATALDDASASGASVTRIDKMSFDCFGEPSFQDALAATARNQLLVAGMETHICVTQTTIAGLNEGFDVHVAADACCSIDHASRRVALTRLAHAGASVTTAESAAYELVGKAGTDEFRALLQAVKRSAGAS